MTKAKILSVLTLILFLLLMTSITSAQNQIPVSVISSGGEKSSAAGFILSSTVGEPFIGKTANTANQHNIGFWYVYGQSTLTGVEEEEKGLPTEYRLEQNYPNPFNPTTRIIWQSPAGGRQTLKVYDILGNEVATLVDEYREAGWYEVEFNPASSIRHPASGVYFYRLQITQTGGQAGDPANGTSYVNTKKMILIK